jgi:hypothetical protein
MNDDKEEDAADIGAQGREVEKNKKKPYRRHGLVLYFPRFAKRSCRF